MALAGRTAAARRCGLSGQRLSGWTALENVIRVLEEVENNKLSDLTFLECSACTGGCVGGPLNFENNYVARSSIRRLVEERERMHPDERVDVSLLTKYPLNSPKPILPNSAMQLDDDIVSHAQAGAH